MGDGKNPGNIKKRRSWLTKSNFSLALQCPAKLFYVDKNYTNSKDEDAFLTALADSGIQVGALAQTLFPDGTEITERDSLAAVDKTHSLLAQKDITLFEAAFKWESFLIRADIFRKVGNVIHLYEVKAKSYEPGDSFFSKRPDRRGITRVTSEARSYLFDIAFQAHVLSQLFPECSLHSYLILPDKSKSATVEGLHQKFFLEREGKIAKVTVLGDRTPAAFGESILTTVPVNNEVAAILQADDYGMRPKFQDGELSFGALVTELALAREADRKLAPVLGTQCKTCEFNAEHGPNGFNECWAPLLAQYPEGDPVFNVWNYRGAGASIANGKAFLQQLTKDDIHPKPSDEGVGMTTSERQWVQVEKRQKNDPTPYVLKKELSLELQRWKFPLHFIDFETIRPAIPFNKGRRPYEQIAFQFSHHQVSADGTVKHQGEYLNREHGKFPNFTFLRELKKQLDKDDGSILIYASHENSVLQDIARQLAASEEPDCDELIAWVATVVKPTQEADSAPPERALIDMCEIVRRFVYLPATNGSNSLKAVLPATLKEVNGQTAQNPYDALPPLFDGYTEKQLDALLPNHRIADGGAAMMAYAKMQFPQMSKAEAEEIAQKLLMYCKLDTLAMVQLWQAWTAWIS